MKSYDEFEISVGFELNTTETWSNTPRSIQIYTGRKKYQTVY